MDYKVILSPEALTDLEDTVTYIARHNIVAAEKLGNQLFDVAQTLATLPYRGRIAPEFADSTRREIIFKSFRIIYRVNESQKTVEIARFWHGARGFPIIPQN